MKTLKKIKLNNYVNEELKEREMSLLYGGSDEDKVCVCSSTNVDNAKANTANGYTTSSGEGSCFYPGGGATIHKALWP